MLHLTRAARYRWCTCGGLCSAGSGDGGAGGRLEIGQVQILHHMSIEHIIILVQYILFGHSLVGDKSQARFFSWLSARMRCYAVA